MNEQKVVKDLTKVWRVLTDAMVKHPSEAAKFREARNRIDEITDNIIFGDDEIDINTDTAIA